MTENSKNVPYYHECFMASGLQAAIQGKGGRLLTGLQPAQDLQVFLVLSPTRGLFHPDQITKTGKIGRCSAYLAPDPVLPDLLKRNPLNKGMNICLHQILANQDFFRKDVMDRYARYIITEGFERLKCLPGIIFGWVNEYIRIQCGPDITVDR